MIPRYFNSPKAKQESTNVEKSKYQQVAMLYRKFKEEIKVIRWALRRYDREPEKVIQQQLLDNAKKNKIMSTVVIEEVEYNTIRISNMFTGIIIENLSNMRRVQYLIESSRTLNNCNAKWMLTCQHATIKFPNVTKKRFLNTQINTKTTYKDKLFRSISGFSTQTLNSKRTWIEIFQVLISNDF